jgi:hypothetical protein
MLQLLNIVIGVFHVLLIVACLIGWISPRTRKAHLILIALVMGCWFLLGLKYGIGYCPLTDWHWQVKQKLGEGSLPNSFIKYLWDHIFTTSISPKAADILTFGAFFVSLIPALYLNWAGKAKQKLANEK